MANDNVIDIVINGKNNASPAIKQVASDVTALTGTVQKGSPVLISSAAGLVQWGDAWGTAASKSQAKTKAITDMMSNFGVSLLRVTSLFGPLIGAGTLLIDFLQNISGEMDKTNAAIAKLSRGIENDLTNTINQLAVNQAKLSGDRIGEIEASTKKELDLAEQAKNERIAKAQEELDAVSGTWAEMSGQRMAAEAKFTTEAAAAEAELANKTILIHSDKVVKLDAAEKKRIETLREVLKSAEEAEAESILAVLESNNQIMTALDTRLEFAKNALQLEHEALLAKIEKDLGSTKEGLLAREAAEVEFQSKVVQLEQEAADQREEILQNLTSSALSIFKSLGDEFEDVVKELDVAQFVQKSANAMDELEKAFNAGAISQEMFEKGTQALRERMEEAISLGYVPTIEKTKELKQATEEYTGTIKSASDQWFDSMMGISEALDDIISKTRQASAAAAGMGSSVSAAGASSSGGSSGTVYDAQGKPFISITQEDLTGPSGSGLTPFNPDYDLVPASQTSPSGSGGGGMGSVNSSQTGQSVFGSDGNYTNLRYKHGGVAPGRVRRARHGVALDDGAVPVLAHPGEIIDQPRRIVDRLAEAVRQVDSQRGGSRATPQNTVNNYHVSVNQQGTVIQQERDWASLVENLAQSMGVRG